MNLERFETFNPVFNNPAHDLSPITTREEFAIEQLKNSLAQAAFWLGVAHSWAVETKQDDDYFTDLFDAIHYTGIAQLKLWKDSTTTH